MLRCLIDPLIPEGSKCRECCLHCDERETCEFKCHGLDELGTEDKIVEHCVFCVILE